MAQTWQWRARRWAVRVVFLWVAAAGILMLLIVLYGFLDFQRRADVIIVLGSGVEADGRPSETQTVRSAYAAQLWQRGVAPRLLCAGGVTGGAPRSEASACREVLLGLGVPADAILLEERSINTAENVRYSLALMAEQGLARAVVVSSRYHLLRARWLFALQGQAVETSPAPIDYLTPSEIAYAYTRELGAFHWQLIRDVFGLPHIYVPVP